MMSLHLNLLSPEKRRNFKNVIKYLFIKEMLEYTILTVTLLAMMYLFAWWVITKAMTDVVSSALLINREAPPVNRDIQDLNRKTKNINASGQDYAQLMPKFVELTKNLPEDIRLNGVDLDRRSNTVVLTGVAATRDSLLNFQKVIGNISWIKGVTVPNSQLFQKVNISFEIRGTLTGLPALKK